MSARNEPRSLNNELDSRLLAHLAGRKQEDPLLARLVRRSPDDGEVTPDRLFRALLRGMPIEGVEVLALPGEQPRTVQAGDVLLRIGLGEPGLGHAAFLADGELRSREQTALAGLDDENDGSGLYAHVVEAGAVPHTWTAGFARRVLDAHGRVPPGQMLVRSKSGGGPG